MNYALYNSYIIELQFFANIIKFSLKKSVYIVIKFIITKSGFFYMIILVNIYNMNNKYRIIHSKNEGSVRGKKSEWK